MYVVMCCIRANSRDFVVCSQNFTKLAVAQGSRQVSEARIREEEAAANAIANQIEAEEEQAQKKQKNKKKKKKR